MFRAIVFATDGVQTLSCDRNVVVSRAEEVRHTLDVSLTGTGTGSVTSNPGGITCAPDCSEVYLHDTVVSLVGHARRQLLLRGVDGRLHRERTPAR